VEIAKCVQRQLSLRRDSWICAEIAVFVLILWDIIFLWTAPHGRLFLASISFIWQRMHHTFSCLFLNEDHNLSRSHLCQIDLCRQGLHSCDFLPCWLWLKVTGMVYQWIYMHQLLLPKLVKVNFRGIFVQEFCYTSGNHGSIWANVCSPSKTTKLVQISKELSERASKKAAP